MKQYTDAEIKAKFAEIFADEFQPYAGGDIKIVQNTPALVEVRIEQMYEYVTITFGHLLKISEFFGTQQIGDTRYHSDGCDTCDYGSSYEITLRIQPEP